MDPVDPAFYRNVYIGIPRNVEYIVSFSGIWLGFITMPQHFNSDDIDIISEFDISMKPATVNLFGNVLMPSPFLIVKCPSVKTLPFQDISNNSAPEYNFIS
jgi:hypothetical protein